MAAPDRRTDAFAEVAGGETDRIADDVEEILGQGQVTAPGGRRRQPRDPRVRRHWTSIRST